MSKSSYAFGRLESRSDKIRSIILSRRLRGLFAAIGGAIVFAAFTGITFALLERAPAKPSEKVAVAAERPAPRAIGSSSRPKSDIRRSQATAPPAPTPAQAEEQPAEESPRQPVVAPGAAARELPGSVAAPVTASVFERYPGPPPRAAEPAREEVTASSPDRPMQSRSAAPEEKTWPVVPRQATNQGTEAKAGVPTGCLPESLRAVLSDLQARFGPVEVIATTHLTTDNHSRGSTRDKLHQSCKAVDIRTARDPREVLAYLKSRPEVGGINSYRNRVVHFDLNANYRAAGGREAEAAGRSMRR
jgi:hypothetical protein